MSFGGGGVPAAPAPAPAAPTAVDPAVKAAADQARQEQASAAGRASTILTSGRGVLMQPPVLRKTLLGQ